MSAPRKNQPQHAEAWGWWVKIRDADSANYAIKMSGFPVFLWGISYLVIGLIILLTGPVSPDFGIAAALLALAILAVGIALIITGLQLKKNNPKIAPFAAGLYIAATALGAILNFTNTETSTIVASSSLVISVLMILLAISGIRGWLWLRANN